jgi:hypothetical protein
LDTGNTWVFNDVTQTVSGDTHTFSGGTGKRVNYIGGLCAPQDGFVADSQDGVVFYGVYDREERIYVDTQEPFVAFPREMQIGDSWVNTFRASTITYHFLGLETATVPAGTFHDSLKIKVDIDDIDPPGTHTTFMWYAKHIGLIKVERTSESPPGFEGCIAVPLEHPLLELQSAWIHGTSYP